MICLSCSAPTTNGLALCERCRMTATVDLEFLPVYFRNLARWRPGRAGSRPVPGSRIPQGVLPARGDVVDVAMNRAGLAVVTWAECLRDDRGVELPEGDDEPTTMGLLCEMFTDHLASIGTLEWAGEFVRDIGHHEFVLRELTMRVVPGWYAGGCRRCGVATYVVPGVTWVTCGGCGVTTYARDHLEVIIDESRAWVAAPKHLAEAIVAMVDTEVSVPRLYDRIRQWSHRERLEPVRADNYAMKRYRMGDVLDLVFSEGQTDVAGDERMGA